MKRAQPVRKQLPSLALLAFAVLCGHSACRDQALHDVAGSELYAVHCAACHGASGAGDGPAGRALLRTPPDLRAIAERNEGVFDETAVLATIDGRREIVAHGSRTMPVWGAVFVEERGDEPMPVWRAMGDARALVDYLRSIQETAPEH